MLLFKLCAMAVIAASMAIMVKSIRPELALQVSVMAGLLILLAALEMIGGIISSLVTLADRYGVDSTHIGIVIKVIGIAYVAQFASQICKDGGEGAISGKIELAARVVMLGMVLPSVISLFDTISALLEHG